MKKTDLIHKLSQYHPHQNPRLTKDSAAVVVFLFENHEKEIFLLLTKRPDTIATYAGDYCFPGGFKEANDPDLLFTAEREIEEELNLQPSHYTYVAQLDDTVDRYGNVVRPFVCSISHTQYDKYLKMAKDEIESIHFLPLDAMKEFNRDSELETKYGRTPLYSYKIDEIFVWGLTARIIVQLREIVF